MVRGALSALLALTRFRPRVRRGRRNGHAQGAGPMMRSRPVVERYRMAEYTGEYRLTQRYDLRHSGVTVYDLTFPSPVKTDIAENNTVYGEYFVPKGKKASSRPRSVLDIMQGNQLIARGEGDVAGRARTASRRSRWWCSRTTTSGARPAAGSSSSPPTSCARSTASGRAFSTAGVRRAWLAARPEVDADNLGMVGTSLGSFLTALTSANEPRIKNVCLLLGGGGAGGRVLRSPEGQAGDGVDRPVRREESGEEAHRAPVDPITYAAQLKGKNLLMIAAKDDEIVPPKAASAPVGGDRPAAGSSGSTPDTLRRRYTRCR